MSDLAIPQNQATSIESLLDLAAGVDFLIRSAHQRQAAIAADQLARGLSPTTGPCRTPARRSPPTTPTSWPAR